MVNKVINKNRAKKTVLTKKAVLKMEKLALANILEDIQDDRKEVEDQRLAIMNILEDVNMARSELQQKYKELEAISELTHSLGLSMELSSVMSSTGNAINEILPGSVVIFSIAPLDADFLDELIYIYSKKPLSSNNIKFVKKESQKFLVREKKSKLYKKKSTNIKVELLYSENRGDKKNIINNELYLAKDFSFKISGNKLGFLSIYFEESKSIPKKQLAVIETIISNVTQTIERLRILVSSEYSRFSNLVDSMSNGVLMFDLNKRVLLANPRAREFIDKKSGDITLNRFLSELHGIKKAFASDVGLNLKKERIDIDKVINKVIANNESVVFQDVSIKNKTFEIFITPIRDFRREIAGGAIILHDITYLKEISQLKSEFVSVASHQLRTPLTSIRLFTEMLLDESVGKINPDQRDYVDSMYKSALNMIQLVNNLLNLSRIEAGKLEVNLKQTNFKVLITDIIKEVDALAKEKKCIINFIAPKKDIGEQITDPSLLRQVIHNLITNAIKYSVPEKCGIDIGFQKKGRNLILNIKDSGIGIPKDMHERMFTKFFRAGNAVKVDTDGNGLGLYIAKTIVDGLNGRIWFDSIENRGTTFFIELPVVHD